MASEAEAQKRVFRSAGDGLQLRAQAMRERAGGVAAERAPGEPVGPAHFREEAAESVDVERQSERLSGERRLVGGEQIGQRPRRRGDAAERAGPVVERERGGPSVRVAPEQLERAG